MCTPRRVPSGSGLPGGSTSMSLTIQSASLPVVETHSSAEIGPATVRSSVSGGV